MTTPRAATMKTALPSEVYLLIIKKSNVSEAGKSHLQVLLAVSGSVAVNVLNLEVDFGRVLVYLELLGHYSAFKLESEERWGCVFGFPGARNLG